MEKKKWIFTKDKRGYEKDMVENKVKSLVFFAMKRSGQHAIIHWLATQAEDCIHYNCCKLNNDNSVRVKKWVATYKNHKPKEVTQKFIMFDKSYGLHIYNFEDRLPTEDMNIPNPQIMIIIRDPYNNELCKALL